MQLSSSRYAANIVLYLTDKAMIATAPVGGSYRLCTPDFGQNVGPYELSSDLLRTGEDARELSQEANHRSEAGRRLAALAPGGASRPRQPEKPFLSGACPGSFAIRRGLHSSAPPPRV